MTNLHTDPAILKALKAAAGHELTADELEKQRVSFVLGSLKDDSTITRHQIEKALANRGGRKSVK